MPIGPGGLDSNGIWQFGEDDSEALASDLLNLGMASVSTAIGAIPPAGILQVVSTTKTDTFSTSATSFTDITDLSATITPSSTSSKILVMAVFNFSSSVETNNVHNRILRDATPIFIGDAFSSATQNASGSNLNGAPHGNSSTPIHLDSPATTSSVTYKLQGFDSDGGTYYVNRGRVAGTSSSYGRSASSITLMEVAG